MLDPNSSNQYDEYLRCYANILNCWGLQNQSREVMKFVCNTPMEHRGIGKYVKYGLLKLVVSVIWIIFFFFRPKYFFAGNQLKTSINTKKIVSKI
jgi:hypothetical protein